MIKTFIRSKIGSFILSSAIALIIFLINFSINWEELNREIVGKFGKRKIKPIIIFWHEHIFAMPWFLPKISVALQSPHADGKILAYAVKWFGLKPIWGSSNKKSFSGFRNLQRNLEMNNFIVITPDGPRGPARKISNGAITLAKISQTPIIPVAWNTSDKWLINSWDKMRIPKPFSKGKIIWGEPIYIPKSLDKKKQEIIKIKIESKLISLTNECDSFFNEK